MADSISISIPADDEGYIALRCPHCGATFKTLAANLNEFEGDVLACAICGLTYDYSQFLLTTEVGEAVQTEVHNLVADMLNQFGANLERSFRSSEFLKVTTSKTPKMPTLQLRAITDLAEAELPCCETKVKLQFADASTVFYCPFCGQVQT